MSSLRSGIKQVKVARPRPLKMGGGTQPELGVEDLLSLVDSVRRILTSEAGAGGFDIVGQLKVLSANLRLSGSSLETNNKDLIEKFAQALLGACRDEKWPLVARVHMLELIELRSMEWRPSDTMNMNSYYKQKLAQIENQQKSQTAPALTNSESDINPFKASFNNNNYQQCSELPSPVKPEPESEPAKVSLCLKVRGEELVVTGVNMELVKTAKIVLNEFFNVVTLESSGVVSVQHDSSKSGTETQESDESNTQDVDGEEEDDTGIELVEPQISYNKAELLAMSRSPYCQELPETWSHIAKELPGVLRRSEPRLQGPTSKLIMREMEGLKRQEEAKPSIM